jgi:hypothetical protein
MTMILATFFAWLFVIPANIEIDAQFVREQDVGSSAILLNGAILLVYILCVTFVFLLLVKKWGVNVFKYVMWTMIFYGNYEAAMMILYAILIVIQNQVNSITPILDMIYTIGFYFFIVFFVIEAIFYFRGKFSQRHRSVHLILTGFFAGVIFATGLPTGSLVFILICISLYDIFAVFYGPLGKLVKIMMEDKEKKVKEFLDKNNIDSEENAPQKAISLKDMDPEEIKKNLPNIILNLGLGDLVFYSALVAHNFIITQSYILTIFVALGVLIGAYMTLKYLVMKRRPLPALPFSMAIGLILFAISWLINQYVHVW